DAAISESKQALPNLDPLPADRVAVYNLACLHSLCAKAIEHDEQLPSAERGVLAESEALRAVDLLDKLGHAGYFRNPGRLRALNQDHDLDPLRNRQDFRRLIEENTPKPRKVDGKN